MNRWNKLCVGAFILGLISIPVASEAYTLIGKKWSTSVSGPSYKWGANTQASGTSARTGFEQAISDWNATPTKVYFSYSSNSGNYLDSYCVQTTSGYGYSNTYGSGGTMTSFESYVNACNSNIMNTAVARSVAGHEMGHGLGLYEGDVYNSLMDQSRDRAQIYKPQQDDINGVNSLYP